MKQHATKIVTCEACSVRLFADVCVFEPYMCPRCGKQQFYRVLIIRDRLIDISLSAGVHSDTVRS